MKIVIDKVEREDGRDRWRIEKTITADDGTTSRLLFILPTDAMEWRAAEYGIDPADTATLLDIVLAEPHLTPDEWSVGHQLHDAPDIPTARQHHLARCAAAKLRVRMSTRAKGSPLERVRAESLMDPEVIAIKAEHVDLARRRHGLRARRVAQVESRADVLRRQLLGPETVRTAPRPDVVEES